MDKLPLPEALATEKITVEISDGAYHSGIPAKVRGDEFTLGIRDLSVPTEARIYRQFENAPPRIYEIVSAREHERLEATVVEVRLSAVPDTPPDEPRSGRDTMPGGADTPVNRPTADGHPRSGSNDSSDVFDRCREAISNLDELERMERIELLNRLHDVEKARGDREEMEEAYDRFVEIAGRYDPLQTFPSRIARKLVRSL